MKIFFAIFLVGFVAFLGSKLTAKTTEHFDVDKTMKNHLDKIHKKAGALEHYDDYESLEDESYEDFENENLETEFLQKAQSLKKRGHAPTDARKVAYSQMQSKHGHKFTRAMSAQAKKKGNSSLVGKNPFYDASAMFDIIVIRKSINILQTLPVPLFAPIHFDADYQSIIGQYLPQGIIISDITWNSSAVTIEYTNTADDAVDTIQISCTQVPYITFLRAISFNPMLVNKFRYQLSDATKLQQFSTTFEVVDKSLFGKGEQNQVSVGAFKSPAQFQSGIIDVDNEIKLNLSTGIIVGLIAVDEFSITLSQFVTNFNPYARKG